MGCPRLGWVSTKFIMEGDPYDEGYFLEYDHDLVPDEIMRDEVVTHTPECDPANVPTLDPVQWPQARKLKAKRKYFPGCVRTPLEVLYSMSGTAVTHYIVEQTLRCLPIQYTHEPKERSGPAGRSGRARRGFVFQRLIESL